MTLLCYCWNLVVFILVSVSVQFWPAIPNCYWLVVLLLLSVVIFRLTTYRWLIGALLALVSAFVHLQAYQQKVEALFHAGANITITGRIESFFKQISHGYEYSFKVGEINGKAVGYLLHPTVRLIVAEGEVMHPGTKWQYSVKLKPVYGRLNEAGFDLERYYASQGWAGRAVATDAGKMLSSTQSLRSRIYNRVEATAGSLEYYGIIKALSFGIRHDISSTQWQLFKNSGLSHLIAISGLHIGIAFSLGWMSGRGLRLVFFRLTALPVFCGLALAFTYAYLAGFSVTTQRAFLMCLLLAVMELSRINQSHWLKLLTALAGLLLFDPMSAMTSSFWLSFSAVAAVYLIMFHPRIAELPVLLKIVVIQIALNILMLPVSLLVFGGFSAMSPLFNIWCVPYFSLVVIPAIFLSLFVTLIMPGPAELLWAGVNLSLKPVLHAIGYSVSGWVSLPDGFYITIIALLLTVILRPLLRSSQIWLIWVLSIVWLMSQEKRHIWQLDVLDVGQGLAILISKDEKAILYDTGNRWETGSMAQSIIAPVLRRRGIGQLDGLILSHMDSDHAGGKAFIESEFTPGLKWSSQITEGYLPCVEGIKWHWNDLKFHVLWPPQLVERSYNPHSCVIRISDPFNSVLLTGDIEKVSEYLLIKRQAGLESDLMLAPHHGSNSSSSESFIQQVKPELAIASLAKGNQWNMPDGRVVQRYRDAGSAWLDTGNSGQISVYFSAKGWRIKKMRQNQTDAWYRQMLRKTVE
ncbi:DNA internalization-related competence protein ComEC/Rec2 [Vibrio sp. JC009]|uniref:DNA internalization-related competence protein ComEC/Rec2 n=1 Tax=Vibrio sp. JC009 TaxID=2912314 RepID=UPI0023AF9C34|nr:DNA internalization-related competence protein ComEC/Rec2 [Vibrio sp. JC009]WED20803.1 DNA internalization-related competence protein ComEC/Rec2 [Vibrio sp. JC009]